MNQSSTSHPRNASPSRRVSGRSLGRWAGLLAIVALVLAACQTAAPAPDGLSAGSPAFDGFGNTVVTGNVLVDASAEATAAVADTVTASDGGSVVIAADGSFTYTPVAGSTGTVTFDFTVTDGTDTDTGTATLNLDGLIWYVDNSVAAGGTGISSDPFATISAGVSAASSGEVVFVATGTGGYTADVELASGVSLIGAGTDLVVGGSTVVAAGTAPIINEGGSVSGAYVTVNSDNTIAGFVIDGSATLSASVIGITNVADYGNRDTNVTISNNTFTTFEVGASETAVRLEAVNGITFQGNTVTAITNPGATQLAPIDLINVGGDINVSSNLYSGDAATRLFFLATDGVTSLTVDSNDFSPTNHPGNRDGFWISTNGGSELAASFTNNTFANIGFISLNISVNGTIPSAIDVEVDGNTFTTAYIGVNLDADFDNDLRALIQSNTFDNTKAESVQMDIDTDSGSTVLDATVRNNTFNNVGVNNFADAIRATMVSTTATSQTMRVLVDSNVVNGAGGAGLSVVANGGASTNAMAVTAVNNDFLATNSNTGLDSAVFTSNTSSTLCVDADTNEVTFDAGGEGSYALTANDTSVLNAEEADTAAEFVALQVNGTATLTGVTQVAAGTCAEPAAPVVP